MPNDIESNALDYVVLDDVLRRLKALEDERAILDLLHSYGHFIDYGRHDEWTECFAPDGAFDIRIRGEQQARFEGHAALRQFISHHTSPPDAFHKHFVVDPRIRVDEDSARVTSYFARINAQDGVPHLVAMGRYEDRVVREDGRWRFAERVADSDAYDDSKQPGTWKKL